MSVVESLLETLNTWPLWKRITETPDRVDQLEAKIKALESQLRSASAEACPRCGARDYRVMKSQLHPELGPAGWLLRNMYCRACEFAEDVTVKPK